MVSAVPKHVVSELLFQRSARARRTGRASALRSECRGFGAVVRDGRRRRRRRRVAVQILDGRIVYSATDLNNFLACEFLTSLDAAVTRGERERPEKTSGQGPLLAKLGEEHEQTYLQQLRSGGRPVPLVEGGRGLDGLIRAAADTEAAMVRGDDFVYQATFFHDG